MFIFSDNTHTDQNKQQVKTTTSFQELGTVSQCTLGYGTYRKEKQGPINLV